MYLSTFYQKKHFYKSSVSKPLKSGDLQQKTLNFSFKNLVSDTILYMNIKIIAVGKIKEKYVKSAVDEYIKRLSPYFRLSVVEIQAERILDESLAEKYKEIEADKILAAIKPEAYIFTLEIQGKMLSSEDFAVKIKELTNSGISELVFIIGGANGLHKKVSDISNFKISFSKMTFTHQMIRIILAEQIYRTCKINNNESYHR